MKINVGDYVISKDRLKIGQVKDFCKCEMCKDRGFYEPIITNNIYITNYDKDNNFKNYTFKKDIIDLIEEKDTLLIYDKEYDDTYKSDVIEDNDKNLCVINYEYNKIIDLKLELYLGNIEIRGILTKEQYIQNAYTIEKER